MNDDKVAASHILSQFLSADFIGINREPPRRIIETPEERRKNKRTHYERRIQNNSGV